MRKLTYFVATSIDGFIAATDGSFDSFAIDGDHMRTIVEEFPDALPAQARQSLGIDEPPSRFDTVLMGRATYEVPGGRPSPYPHLRQFVVSSSLRNTPSGVEVISTDVVESVRRLKREDGLGIWLCGGGALAAVLLPEIDELILKVNPIVLGSGIPLFRGATAASRFALTADRAFESGVVFLTYTATTP